MSSVNWTNILNELNRDVSREQPTDVVQWGADWFQAKLKQERSNRPNILSLPPPSAQQLGPHTLSPFSEQGPSDSPFGNARRATVPSDSTPAGIFTSPFGAPGLSAPASDRSPFSEGVSFSSPFGQQEEHHDEPPVPSYALGRRTSVSAESLVPTNQRPFGSTLDATMEEDESTPNPNSATPSFPKSEDQLERIRAAIKPNFLFRNLDPEQEADVLAAMKEVDLIEGEMIIEQGAAGDYFYVVESGTLEVFVKRDGQIINVEQGDSPQLGKKVATCTEGNSFGELALMHNAPRAASIVSTSPCVLWALDRVSFRTILLDHTSRKRRLYETFLSEVPILASLQPQERAKIADVLESRTFNEGEDVIKEGEVGEEFFLVESGTAVAVKNGPSGETVVKSYKKGDYFGELALLNRQNRLATVRATGPEKLHVAALGAEAFTRLLGPVKDIMARSAGELYGFGANR